MLCPSWRRHLGNHVDYFTCEGSARRAIKDLNLGRRRRLKVSLIFLSFLVFLGVRFRV
jgi:hypothetical protein